MSDTKPTIKLGDRVRDTYTGFEGVLIGRTEWLYGCARLTIESTKLHEGKTIPPESFDEQRIELVQTAAPVVTAESRATTGGPMRDPSSKPRGE